MILIPGGREVQAALLHPTVEIGGGDLVGHVEGGVVGDEESDGRVFVRDAVRRQVAVERQVVGRETRVAQFVGVLYCSTTVPPFSA